jgi:hypothetical protein
MQGDAKPQASQMIMIRGQWRLQLVAVVESERDLYSSREMVANKSG